MQAHFGLPGRCRLFVFEWSGSQDEAYHRSLCVYTILTKDTGGHKTKSRITYVSTRYGDVVDENMFVCDRPHNSSQSRLHRRHSSTPVILPTTNC